jgi:UDP-GlcNAc:undecaprenyl-phosphate/decaprenyl-phosphate GlcNAc-1-phosphate transferase
MMTLPLLFALSLALSLLLTPVARALARRHGLVDRPDGRRKLHAQPIPVAGGLPLLVSGVVVLLVALALPGPFQLALIDQGTVLIGLLLGVVILCGVGVADDLQRLRVRHKVLGQLLAAAVVIAFGVRVQTIWLFDWSIDLGLLAVPFTLFWLLGAINSLNLLDGMDGLLCSVGIIVCLALGAMAGLHGDASTTLVAVVLASALLGFLRYNFPPATIFLGDSGSMLIGLVVGVLAIRSSLKGPATVALAAPTALLILPIFDTTAAIVRRKLTGRSLYATDHSHLHHCLLRTGLSRRWVLLVVAGLSLVTAVGTLASLAWKNEVLALLAALVVVGTLLVTRLFGHAEFVLLQQRLTSLAGSFLTPSAGLARNVEVRLHGTAGWQKLWARLTDCAVELNLQSVRLDVNAPALQEGYHARWDRHAEAGEVNDLWRTEVPLAVRGQTVGRLVISGPRGQDAVSLKIASVAEVVAEIERAMAGLAALQPSAKGGSGPNPTDSRVKRPPSETCANGPGPRQPVV